MMTAAIFIKDAMGIVKPTPVETFTFQGEQSLKDHLHALQKGYCADSSDRVSVKEMTIKNGKRVVYAESDADFFHIAYIGMKLKQQVTVS